MRQILVSYNCNCNATVIYSLSVSTAIFQVNWVIQHQNVSILDFIGAKVDGGAPFSALTLLVGLYRKGIWPVKSWMLVCLG